MSNPHQEAFELAHQWMDEIIDYLLEQYPMPPDYEELSNKQQMDEYMTMTPDKLDQMLQEQGDIAVARYLVEMERRRQASIRSKGNGNL